MNYGEFIGQVQYRAELGSRGEAVRATRATLQTLGDRLQPDEADDLASVLPMEIDRFLTTADSGQLFGYGAFGDPFDERAEADKSAAGFYARVVMDVLNDAIPPGEREDVESQLPGEFGDLFDLTETGSYYLMSVR